MQTPILVIDDDETIRDLVRLTLTDEGYDVVTVGDTGSAFEALRQCPPSVILLDSVPLRNMDEEFVQTYRRMPGPHAPIVLFSAAPGAAARAVTLAVDAVLVKPFDLGDLVRLAQRYGRGAS